MSSTLKGNDEQKKLTKIIPSFLKKSLLRLDFFVLQQKFPFYLVMWNDVFMKTMMWQCVCLVFFFTFVGEMQKYKKNSNLPHANTPPTHTPTPTPTDLASIL